MQEVATRLFFALLAAAIFVCRGCHQVFCFVQALVLSNAGDRCGRIALCADRPYQQHLPEGQFGFVRPWANLVACSHLPAPFGAFAERMRGSDGVILLF
eukprot:CAMPEP_0198125860 /NCGR_PEP_ID=MMETSP1442-20131203/43540_1 /TAXON_ID= /ORGANISM="Craspedostauros australis, Strain CCMP3328" /LENGTH=98 /DNA_ID=CAMNT_0043785535 /DNA_START=330 /DNA_END=623 /DNA_ORIENTATION=+